MARPDLSIPEIQQRVAAQKWFHRIEVAPGIVTPGPDDTARKAELVGLPKDLTGKSVLDIGAYDGFFSFEAEKRGAARVMAFDHDPPDTCGFNTAHEILGSKVEHRVGSVYDLDPATFGTFDVVLFLGVIYHLRHPLLALERIHSVCREVMYLESQVTTTELVGGPVHGITKSALPEAAIAEFFPGKSLNDDPTNWWAPTTRCLAQWISSHGFAADLVNEWPSKVGGRAAFRCQRQPGALPWWVSNY